ncbi:MAG: hypothetical protein K5695_15545 [Oscillospiraceae bacterium]|nr:hypothetical protein [Oscillospiraceae bacterium]
MKKIILTAVAVLLTVCSLFLMTGCTSSKDSTADDYAKIETARSEMEKMAKSSARSALGDQGQWYIYDMRLMYQKDNDFFNQMKSDLGDDFNSVLSNGDPIFIGILPFKKSYRIYAGSPDEAHMLYPDWNYTALAKPSN